MFYISLRNIPSATLCKIKFFSKLVMASTRVTQMPHEVSYKATLSRVIVALVKGNLIVIPQQMLFSAWWSHNCEKISETQSLAHLIWFFLPLTACKGEYYKGNKRRRKAVKMRWACWVYDCNYYFFKFNNESLNTIIKQKWIQ